MTKEEFIKELKEEINLAKCTFDIRKENSKRSEYFYSTRRSSTKRPILYGDRYLSLDNYINIKGLYYFAIKHKELSSSEIENLIKQTAWKFKFLNDFIETVQDAVDELRLHNDTVDVAISYKQSKLSAEKHDESKIRKF